MTLGFIPLNAKPRIFTLGKFEKEIIIINIYINNFLFASNSLKVLALLKNVFLNEYNIKNLKEVKIIIR